MEKRPPVLFFYPTFNCNEHCSFCFFKNKASRYKNHIPFDKIKTNINYLTKKFSIRSIVMAGGEPTIYKDFIPLMDYLGKKYIFKSRLDNFYLATNVIKCADKKFTDYLYKFFIPSCNILSQLDIATTTLEENKAMSKLKKNGILNLSERLVNINNILILTKDNILKTPQIIKFLINIYRKYYKNSNSYFQIELRIPFLIRSSANTYLAVPKAKDIKKHLTRLVSLIANEEIPMILRNIPLCYVDNLIDIDCFVKKSNPSREMIEFGPDSFSNPEKIKPEKFLSRIIRYKECKKCKFSYKCSSIDSDYFEKFSYPTLKPF